MRATLTFAALATGATLLLAGCTSLPGKPAANSIPDQPNDILDFRALYAQNCAGCHGANGKGGAAIGLADPLYLAITTESEIHNVTANGVPGTAMPAFAQSAGGMLTDAQVQAITHGIEGWARTEAIPHGAPPPPYAAGAVGNAPRGADTYHKFCGSCHGADGKGTNRASSIVDPAFLALVSNQSLRTTAIVGRSDLGAPNYCGDVPTECMTAQDVTDVVAWLASQRTPYPGQPYPNTAQPTGDGK
ncbi:MAG: c-type cytochrome [Candidatus Acidiferrales bacterium]